MNEEKARAWDAEWTHGDRAVAKQMAADLVESFPDSWRRYEGVSLEDMVKWVDIYRADHRDYDRRCADIWILAQFAPQQIGGTGTFVLRG